STLPSSASGFQTKTEGGKHCFHPWRTAAEEAMCTRAHTLHGMQGIRNPMLNLVNEPGLYSLILRSKVTAAEMQRRRSVSCVRVRQVPPLAVRDHVPAGQKKGDVSFLQLPAGVNYATSVGLAAAKPPMRHLWTGGRENHG